MLEVHELKILGDHAQLAIFRQPLLLYRALAFVNRCTSGWTSGCPNHPRARGKQSPDLWEEWSGDS